MPCYLRTHPELLARLRGGDRAAALEAYRLFVRLLDRVLRRGFIVPSTGLRVPAIKKRSQLEDALQETFARALCPAAILAYDDQYDDLPFLCGIARNVITKDHRHHGSELPAGGRDSWAEDRITDIEVHDEPEQTDEDTRALAIMREYVAELPEARVLRYWPVAAGAALAAAAAVVLVVRAGVTGVEPGVGPVQYEEGVIGPAIEISCADGTLAACPVTSSLVFAVSGNAKPVILSAYAERVGTSTFVSRFFGSEGAFADLPGFRNKLDLAVTDVSADLGEDPHEVLDAAGVIGSAAASSRAAAARPAPFASRRAARRVADAVRWHGGGGGGQRLEARHVGHARARVFVAAHGLACAQHGFEKHALVLQQADPLRLGDARLAQRGHVSLYGSELGRGQEVARERKRRRESSRAATDAQRHRHQVAALRRPHGPVGTDRRGIPTVAAFHCGVAREIGESLRRLPIALPARRRRELDHFHAHSRGAT